MLVQIKKKIANASGKGDFVGTGVLVGSRYYTHDDGPFEVDNKKASEMIKAGIADAVTEMARETAQKAVEQRAGAQRR